MPANSKFQLTSNNIQKKDISIYCGTGGNIFTYFRLFQYF